MENRKYSNKKRYLQAAIIAAIFIDAGYEVCRDVVLEWDGIEKFFD